MTLTSTESDPKATCLRINESTPLGGLFEGDRSKLHPESRLPWRISPEPFWLTRDQADFLESLGPLLLKCHHACNLLYHQSVKGLQPSWVHSYLDRGKPERVVDFGRMNRAKSQLPIVIRPDLILTADGVRITELDSVPGGIGFTGQIHSLYSELGYNLIGGGSGLIEGFYDAVAATSEQQNPTIAIVVSDESEDYREEMVYLADSLQKLGHSVYCCHPKELSVDDDGLLLGVDERSHRVDIIYRFFELFDLPNIPKAELITYHSKKNAVRITPPLKAFLEEKMWMAFLHYPELEPFWTRELGPDDHHTLRELIPRSWILDPTLIPPHASVSGMQIKGRCINSWNELKTLTKKERELVVKPSGFSLDAYGSRGVAIGHDLPEEEWAQAITGALQRFETHPHLLQEFHKGARLEASYYDFYDETIRRMHGRVLLRPYYFIVGEETRLAGIQALVCPSDKKVLHGMVDAVLVPCAVRDE